MTDARSRHLHFHASAFESRREYVLRHLARRIHDVRRALAGEVIGVIHVNCSVDDTLPGEIALRIGGEDLERIHIRVVGAHPEAMPGRTGLAVVVRFDVVAVGEERLHRLIRLWAGRCLGDGHHPGADDSRADAMATARRKGPGGQQRQQADQDGND